MTQHCVTAPRLSGFLAPYAALAALLLLGGCAGMHAGKVPGDYRGGYARGDKVLVMLPQSGPYAQVAEAVREGVLAANGADDTGARPQIAFADSASTGKIGSNYDKGVTDGATQVIGPLGKASVKSLGTRESLPVTTLALNQLVGVGKPPQNLFQFSLSPEAEGTSVAEAAHAQGLTRALMIYPEDRGGTRRASAFRQKWKADGGVLVADMGFAPAATSAAAVVSKLLAAGDADFVFLAGDANQAVKVYPQIRKAAADVPVIAPGVVYSGNKDQKRDKTLAGLYFVDMPWMLGIGPEQEPLKREDVRSEAPYLSTPLGRRLYAMGIDAYRMAPRVATMAAEPGSTFPGRTGVLSVDLTGRVKRELSLARFTADGPEAAEHIETGTASQGSGRTPRPEPASNG